MDQINCPPFTTENQYDTRVAYPADRCVHDLFHDQAVKTPDRTAVVFEESTLTYGELDRRSTLLAHRLQEMGVSTGSFVAVNINRSLEMIVSLLGILKAGGAYVPLDLSYPEERITFMLDDVAAPVIITQSHLVDQLPSHNAQVICLDTGWGENEGDASIPPEISVTAMSPAYVMYTSGSTGRPKGVVIPHRGIVRLVCGSSFTTLDHDRIFLQLAPVSFDASTLEIWGALLHGAKCVLYPKSDMPDPYELGEMLAEYNVTSLWLTASLFNAIISEAPEVLRPVKELMTGGEALSVNHIRKALELLPDTQLINGYGPTESTTFTCCYPIPRDLADVPRHSDDYNNEGLDAIPIGRPIANTQVYILDESMQPVPEGEEGELYIGGDGLALGYHNLPDLTAERFVPAPFTDDPEARLYKTGDKVRYLPGGYVDFMGRFDDQIKLRGFRIELGEITSKLAASDLVDDVVVILREDAPGIKKLVAYVTAAGAEEPTSTALRAFLQDRLPKFMVPDAFVTLDKIPLNPNGKADRKALPAPTYAREVTVAYVAADSEVERQLAQIWADLLNVDQVGMQDNFFELGGNSILTVQVASRIRQEFQLAFPVVKLFQYPTIRDLAAYINSDKDDTHTFEEIESRMARKHADGASQPIAIIGMVGRFPGADSVDELWDVLSNGRATTTFFRDEELSGRITDRQKQDPHYVKANGVVADADKFDAAFFGINPREAEVMDPQHRVFLELAYAALEDAGYDPDTYAGMIGLYAGMGENTYRRIHVTGQSTVDDFQIMLGNDVFRS